MIDVLKFLTGTDRYMPHGHCYLWQTPLVGLHVISDAVIALSYFSIPIALTYFLRQGQILFRNIFTLFGAFIFLCGLGHLLEIWTLWYPAYWVSGIEKAATALVSIYTAWKLWEVLPPFLSMDANLRRSQARWQTITDALPICISYVDRALRYQFVNRNYETWFGYDRDQIQRKSVPDIIGAPAYPQIRPYLDRVFSGERVRYETQVPYQTGGFRDVESIMIPDLDENHQVRGFYALVTDISQRKAAEERLRRSEALLQTINQVIPLGIYVGNAENDRVLHYNREFCRLWHLQHLHDAIESGEEISHDEVMSQCLDAIDLEAFVSTAQPSAIRNDLAVIEDEVPLLDGRTFRRFCVAVTEGENFLGQLLIFEDISDRKAAEAQLRHNNLALSQTNAELEKAREAAIAASQAKSEFLSTMSHELRTPLNVILGFSRILADEKTLNSEQYRTLETILRSGEHLLSLINDVLDLAKIEAGKVELITTPFNLHHLLSIVVEMLQVKSRAKLIALNLDIAPQVPTVVEADEAKLRQILLNLLGNAVKFTDRGGVTLRVSAAQSPSPELDNDSLVILQFQVEDTGNGIAPEELERIFDAFDRGTAGRRSAQGTGLGLTICRHFVELMGGNIHIDSTVGVGTTVSFHIPVTAVNSTIDRREKPSARRIARVAPDQPTYRLLVVEDRWDSRQMLVTLLQRVGFETLEAENGQEAIDLWQQHQPHLILMDMRMPVMDGYEAIGRIRRHVAGHAVAIIALTASAFDSQRNLLLSAGCDDFALKPVRQEDLLAKISRHLGVRYVYEDAQLPFDKKNDDATLLTPESFAVMPREWVERVNLAAGTLAEDDVHQALAEIPQTDRQLQQQLERLVEDFRFDTIYDLTNRLLENSVISTPVK